MRSGIGPRWNSCGAAPVDLLVIGGGITGAGIARDAAMRGLRTVLVEQHDLALRHQLPLQPPDPRRAALPRAGRPRAWSSRRCASARSCCASRPTWSARCPSSSRCTRATGCRCWKLWAGIWLYDLLAAFRNVRRHRMLGKRALLAAGADAARAGAAWAAPATSTPSATTPAWSSPPRARRIRHGARSPTTCRSRSCSGPTAGCAAPACATASPVRTATVRASVVVNATGPWCDSLRRLEDPGATPLLRPTKGVARDGAGASGWATRRPSPSPARSTAG